jgi:N-acyl-D-aspartate/D-glutamate deacylase
MLDMLIRNAEVYDGTGMPGVTLDVGIENGKIAYIGKDGNLVASVEIDGSTLDLVPGFIDSHTHSDSQLYMDPSREYKLKQGITTEIGGQCGWSPAPLIDDAPHDAIEYFQTLGIPTPFSTFNDAIKNLSVLKFGTHQACFVGHHFIRASVLGMTNRKADKKETMRMCSLVEEAMQAGAFGLSTGLCYAPGCYADTEELIALAEVVARYGGKYTSHIRNEGDLLVESVQEALRIGEEAGLPVNISHLKALYPVNFPKIDTVLELIESANEHGACVTFDTYPYDACSATILSTLPPSYLSHGMDWLMEHLEGKENIEKLRKAIYEPTENWENPVAKIGVKNQLIARALVTPEIVGMRISEYAAIRGLDDIEAYAEIIRCNNGKVQDIRFALSEDNIMKILRHPLCTVGSDGLYRGDRTPSHMRAFGTFPRFLGRYVREKKLLRFEEGIRRITGLPADQYSLTGKGYIKVGYDADLVLLSKTDIIDRATYKAPFIPNEGIHMVFVKGEAAVVKNVMTGVMGGQVILFRK